MPPSKSRRMVKDQLHHTSIQVSLYQPLCQYTILLEDSKQRKEITLAETPETYQHSLHLHTCTSLIEVLYNIIYN